MVLSFGNFKGSLHQLGDLIALDFDRFGFEFFTATNGINQKVKLM